ncbi:MAG: PilZ domain-containing protein [Desulfuromonadaceae bacterium]|nr:PilZ domain-containing protein [Desulfuromonadaceae bacterium]
MITILLICREGVSRNVYHAELASSGVLLVCVQSLMGFFRTEVYCSLSGILVDMPTYMRCSDEEKSLLTELVGHFPSLRLKCNEPTGEIRTLPFGAAYPGNSSPAVFVQKYCTTFIPRKIRTGERSLHHLPALLNTCLPAENDSGLRTVTANISREGCFLISFEPRIVGDRGWLTFPGWKDSTPILVEVCWVQSWGESRSLPGFGVRFIDLTDAQKDELRGLGGQSYFLEE